MPDQQKAKTDATAKLINSITEYCTPNKINNNSQHNEIETDVQSQHADQTTVDGRILADQLHHHVHIAEQRSQFGRQRISCVTTTITYHNRIL